MAKFISVEQSWLSTIAPEFSEMILSTFGGTNEFLFTCAFVTLLVMYVLKDGGSKRKSIFRELGHETFTSTETLNEAASPEPSVCPPCSTGHLIKSDPN